ncbi:MAG: hypothetical protein NC115_08235 [Bacteroidales bacterium]|nr:hypothetical protein [Bacteroidales bacterium]
MKHFIAITLCCMNFICLSAKPNPDIKEAIQDLNVTPLPYNCFKTEKMCPECRGIWNYDNILYSKLFTDFGLTDWFIPEDEGPCGRRKFYIKNAECMLMLINAGSIGDVSNDLLVSVTPEDEIIDQMYVKVIGFDPRGIIPAMSFRITETGEIITSHLVPKDNVFKPIAYIDTLEAQRVDTVYRLDSDNKFKKVMTVLFEEKTYTIDVLSKPGYNI